MRIFLLPFIAASALAADVPLLTDGKSDYQIVVPDKLPSEALAEGLNQTARLLQTAMKANGAEVAVVREEARDVGRPALFLGDTRFAVFATTYFVTEAVPILAAVAVFRLRSRAA